MLPHVLHKELNLVGCHGCKPFTQISRTKHEFSLLPRPRLSIHRSYDRTKKLESKLSASASNEAFTSLSTYPLEFKDKHYLFESFLVELVKHLDKAPILQTIQVSDKITFHHETILDDQEEDEFFDRDSDVFMFCRAVPNSSTIKNEKSTCLLPSGLESDDGYLTGSVGDCCGEVDSDANLDYQFWGLVVKSSLFPKMQGCFLLRTTRAVSGDHCTCQCTHYSLTRVSAGVPLIDQYDAAWLV